MYAPLDALPLWGLLLGAAVALGLALEIGYRAGRWRHVQRPDEKVQPVGAMVASILTGVFIQSLNDLIDLHAERLQVGLRSRIPLVIWVGLFGLAMLSMAAVGYQSGICATSRSPAMPGLVLAFAIVLSIIADLDRPREGLLQVSQQSMQDVQNSMQPAQSQSKHIQTRQPYSY
jgi:hypothetical protein